MPAAIASIVGHEVRDPYGVSKLAVRGLTQALATEFVSPGLTATENAMQDVPETVVRHLVENLQLVQRVGQVTDVSKRVLFLCSDAASFVTGETFKVSGGYPRTISPRSQARVRVTGLRLDRGVLTNLYEAITDHAGVTSPRPFNDMGGIQALTTKDRAFLPVGGVLVLGDRGQLVRRGEHPPRRARSRVAPARRDAGLLIRRCGHVHKDLRSCPPDQGPHTHSGCLTSSCARGSWV
jgi:hypothetical protein